MPLSYTTHTVASTASGSGLQFSVNYPYILRSHVKVYYGRDILAGTHTSLLVDGTDYNWTTDTQITLSAAPSSQSTLTIIRETPTSAQLVPWQDGSNLIADDLNKSDKQNLYAVQELQDKNGLASDDATAAAAAATLATTAANSATAAAAQSSTDSATAISTANAASALAATANTNSLAASASAATATAQATASAASAASSLAASQQASTDSAAAQASATAAQTSATAAAADAAQAQTDSASAISTANAASALATTADGNATTALNNSRQSNGQGGFTTAISIANSASTTASNSAATAASAVTTANAATATANAASAAVANVAFYSPIAALANLPSSPANEDRVEMLDSTGVQSSSSITGVPTGFVGSSDLTVRLQYSSSTSKWEWQQYFAADPENRYLANYLPVVKGDGTSSGQVGKITLNCSNNNHGVSIQSPAHSAGATYTITLPTNAGQSGQCLITDGSGVTSWSTIDLSTRLALAGGTMTGALTLAGAPTSNLHAATKAYADTMLPLAGGTLTGALTLAGAPTQNLHPATKQYVDDQTLDIGNLPTLP